MPCRVAVGRSAGVQQASAWMRIGSQHRSPPVHSWRPPSQPAPPAPGTVALLFRRTQPSRRTGSLPRGHLPVEGPRRERAGRSCPSFLSERGSRAPTPGRAPHAPRPAAAMQRDRQPWVVVSVSKPNQSLRSCFPALSQPAFPVSLAGGRWPVAVRFCVL